MTQVPEADPRAPDGLFERVGDLLDELNGARLSLKY
jgi:hypothetical protein